MDKQQSYANHRRFVVGYHIVLTLLALLIFLGAAANCYRAMMKGSGRLEAVVVLLIAIALVMVGGYARTFALKAQDRVIRLEESLRHERLCGAPLDPRLTIRQVIGLRFAGDDELGELAKRAAEEGLSEDAIKKAVRSWRGDHERV